MFHISTDKNELKRVFDESYMRFKESLYDDHLFVYFYMNGDDCVYDNSHEIFGINFIIDRLISYFIKNNLFLHNDYSSNFKLLLVNDDVKYIFTHCVYLKIIWFHKISNEQFEQNKSLKMLYDMCDSNVIEQMFHSNDKNINDIYK